MKWLLLILIVMASPAWGATVENSQDYVACSRHHVQQTGPVYSRVGGPPVMVTASDLAHYTAGWEACSKVQTFWDMQPTSPDLTAVPLDDATMQARIRQYP